MNNSEENVCPVRETLGVRGINTDFKLNYCQLFLHNSLQILDFLKTADYPSAIQLGLLV